MPSIDNKVHYFSFPYLLGDRLSTDWD